MDHVELSSLLELDEGAPSGLRWKMRTAQRMRAGDPAGSLGALGYWCVSVLGKRLLAHRIIWALVRRTALDGLCVDHINGVRSDNRICNLRLVPRALNQRNQTRRKSNTSGVCGVFQIRQKKAWRASWKELDGSTKQKDFPFARFGEDAFGLAVRARAQAIERLNTQGAGYTDRHGQ